MERARRYPGREAPPEFGDTAALEEVRLELAEIEGLAREISDLTAGLRARLTPEEFRQVWALRDAVERLALAEGLLRDRRLLDELEHHLPFRLPALRAMRRRYLADELAVDDVD
jgi:hypothetical protein